MSRHPIHVANVTKTYRSYPGAWGRLRETLLGGAAPHREFVALEGLSFEVPRGGALGVLGANGAGKSTLLKILAGIVEPTTGTVEMAGRVASIIELGTGFHPEFTGRENVFLNASIMGFSPDHARAAYDGIAEFSELGRYLEMPVKTYSSGMFVRLAFAVAVSAQPDILLVDEALAVGDAVFSHRCLGRIRRMRENGVTIVFVSHDTNMVSQVCDQAILLERGRLTAEGPPRDVIHQYLLQVAERLTTLGESRDRMASKFHEVGAVESATETGERRFGSFQARITDIFVEDYAGKATTKFLTSQVVRFRMFVRFDAPMSNPVFGVMLRNRYGIEIFGTNTHLRKMETGDVKAGTALEVNFQMPLELGGGAYSVSLAVHSADGHFYDYRNDVRVIEILPSPESGGIVHLPTTIGIKPVDSNRLSDEPIWKKVYSNAPVELAMGEESEPYLAGEWFAPQVSEGRVCRWMGGHGQVFLGIPEGATKIVVNAQTFDPKASQEPLLVDALIGDCLLGSGELRSTQTQALEFPLKQAGTSGVSQIHLRASRTWVPLEYNPDSTDSRALSIFVSKIAAE
ncbi:MAG: ABC transporter ATP-binding protein [Candidatus Sumerlaeaceae bacterium]|nr:ABC transporter ATP-binding protein [Candidatus Sumerlaeaceae bacterium]